MQSPTTLTTTKVGLRYGLIYGLTSIGIMLFVVFTDTGHNLLIRLLEFALNIIFLSMAMNYYKAQNGGFMSFAKGLGVGATTSAVSNFVYGFFTLLYFKYIAPEAFEAIAEAARETWEKAKMSESQIQIAEKFLSPEFSFLSIVFFGTLWGVILSLVIAAILQKKKPEF